MLRPFRLAPQASDAAVSLSPGRAGLVGFLGFRGTFLTSGGRFRRRTSLEVPAAFSVSGHASWRLKMLERHWKCALTPFWDSSWYPLVLALLHALLPPSWLERSRNSPLGTATVAGLIHRHLARLKQRTVGFLGVAAKALGWQIWGRQKLCHVPPVPRHHCQTSPATSQGPRGAAVLMARRTEPVAHGCLSLWCCGAAAR